MEHPDDYCEACGEKVANRECAHGILCDDCDAAVHGAIGAPCSVERAPRQYAPGSGEYNDMMYGGNDDH